MKSALIPPVLVFISNFIVISLCYSASAFAADKSQSAKYFPPALKNQRPRFKSRLYPSNAANPKNNIISVETKIDLRKASYKSLIREVLSGYIVALSTLPASAAYGTLLGISPLDGIWSSVIVGLIIPLLAGGPGVISGAAGVIAIPISKLLLQHNNINYMSASILCAAALELCFSLLKLGKLGQYITEPVIVGFMNAFALFLLNVQVKERECVCVCVCVRVRGRVCLSICDTCIYVSTFVIILILCYKFAIASIYIYNLKI